VPPSSPGRERSISCARPARNSRPGTTPLRNLTAAWFYPPLTRPNRYGGLLAWPESAGRPRRVAGAKVVLADGKPCLFLEKGMRKLSTFPAMEESQLAAWAARALVKLADQVKGKSLRIQDIDGDSALSSKWAESLRTQGFRDDYTGIMVLGRVSK
jgi:ATP-dependent Lhr-like helicase